MGTSRLSLKAWAYLVWGLAVLFFFTHYIVRVAPSVMVAPLMRDFHANAFELGNLSAFFFYIYVPMQIPVGMLVDRFGARRLLTLATLIASIGCFMFAHATTLHTAEIGRFILGLGSSFGFVCTLKLVRSWFPHSQFGFFAGATQAVGTFGGVMGEIIVSFSIAFIGWRVSMSIIASLFIILSFLIFLIVRDRPPIPVNKIQTISQNKIPFGESLWIVIRNSQSWYNAFYVMTVYATTTAFGGLWGVSFLERVYDISVQKAAVGISFLFLGITVGAPCVGAVSDYLGRRRPLMFISAISGLILLSIIMYVPGLPVWAAFTCLFLFGFMTTGFAVAYAVAGEINPCQTSGTSIAFANMASILGGTLLQPLIGFFLGLFWNGVMLRGIPFYSAQDFKLSMSVLIVCFVLAIFFAFKVKETYCHAVGEAE